MKKTIIITSMMIFNTIICNGQGNEKAPLSTFTGMITGFQQGKFNTCSMTVQKGMDSPEIMVFAFASQLRPEDAKYFDGECKLKESYTGKKFTITYIEKRDVNYVKQVSMVGEGPVVLEKDNFPAATCKVYDIVGKLLYLVENNTIYTISNGKKETKETKLIQNKDEVCVRDNQCVKAVVGADGCVSIFHLPNTAEKTATLKIVGDKIYRTQKGGCDMDEYTEHYIFKGSKTQAALIAVYSRMGMGH